MCGRYTTEAEFSQIGLVFRAELASFRPWSPTFNISPSPRAGFEQPFVVQRSLARELRLGRWWLIPHWWRRDLNALPTSFNARAEDIADKPMFRDAYRRRRCLVPATGWREFVAGPSGKQPYHFSLGGELFAFTGVASSWTSPEGELVESFAIVTTEPSPAASRIHSRMPLVLPTALHDAWLDPNQEPGPVLEAARLQALTLEPEIVPTDPVANNSRYEGPRAMAPALAGRAPTASDEDKQTSLFPS